MAVNAVNPERVRVSGHVERVVDFDPAAVSAPFALRCGALLADYLIVIVIPAGFLLMSRASGNDGAALINRFADRICKFCADARGNRKNLWQNGNRPQHRYEGRNRAEH